ncbi:MAG: hypothetical protein RIN56_01395 [Sporomusaceae bacterium]|nr:hypothetical protein [Sporomusaceae bacterium]
MAVSDRSWRAPEYTVVVLVSFIVLQTLLVIMHEFIHSTVAWLLGHMNSPFGIVWGNPLTLTGWDEGVEYSRLFAAGHRHAAAAIGASPLVVHAAIVAAGFRLMKAGRPENRWLFHVLFWFVIANFMELFAYITMASFVPGGDVGIFNLGLMVSPWFLFVGGSLTIAAGLKVLYEQVLPRMYAIFARGNRSLEWTILQLTGCALFLWGSGLRVAVYRYPDPQWLFGLIGVAAFCLTTVLYRPR